MNNSLANIIRLITTKGKSEFTSSLREELDDRLYSKMANVYISMSESLYRNHPSSIISESVVIQENVKAEKPVVAIISSLQESIRDEKTIVHRFLTGESVTITHDDSRCLVKVHDSLNRVNQEKMRKLMSESYSEYNKILQFSKKHTERTQK
jgi:hypothetical protein